MTRDTLHGLFTAQAQQTPDRVAVEGPDYSVCYGELNAQANRLAHLLIARGVGPESAVAICLERSADLIAGILGILKAGGAYVPLDASYPAERLRYMVSDSGARLIVTRRSLAPRLAHCGADLVVVDDPASNLDACSPDNPIDLARPEHLAYIIYTSGSTGVPKGVLVEHRNVVNSLRGLQAAFPAGPDAAYLFKSNHTFDASLLEMFGPMWEGGRIVVLRPGGEHDPMAVLDAVAAHRVTHLFFVTSMMDTLLATCPPAKVETLRSLQYLLVGGEAMPARLAARLRALAGPVRVSNVYGPTETAIICTGHPMEPGVASLNTPIGRMLGGLVARLLDESGREVRDGEIGELHIGGASVARGYLNAPDLTGQRFISHPSAPGERLYRTGDLCRLLADGAIEYVDRVDRQIKIRGYRVDLGEIETHLLSHPDISAAAVTATGPSGDLRLSAYYVASDGSLTVPPSALRRHLQRFLPDHMLPAAWLQMPRLPLNDNGKVDRKALPAIDAPPSLDLAPAPRTLRETIVAAWARELGVRDLGPDADFFAMGGHSLSAARVAAELAETTRRTLTVSDLYRAPTIAAFERLVAKAPRVVDVREGSRQANGDEFPLSYDQLGFWVLDKLKLPYLNVIARRRLNGRLEASALAAALERVVAEHPPLRSRLHTWTPRQTIRDRCAVDLVERDLSAMPSPAREAAALTSMDELARRARWGHDGALVEVRLVTLGPESCEVQIGMPHVVSDEASGSILFDELSRHYLDIVRREPYTASPHDGFAAFVRDERDTLRGTLPGSVAFWEDYFEDATPIFFPETAVLEPSATPESVYIDLPRSFVDALERARRDHRAGIAELLYAASMRAVMRFAETTGADVKRVLHVPRSTRDRGEYDGAIGLLARIDFLKLDLAGSEDLVSLARQVRRAALETSAHQRCPTMIKSAALNKARWATRDRWCRLAARAAGLMLGRAGIDFEVLLAQTRLAAMRMTNERDFSVAVNVLNSFVSEPSRSLFGMSVTKAPVHPTYAPPFRRVLELYFLREAGHPQLMLNGDLRPEFRRAIGMSVVQEIQNRYAAA